MGRVGGESSGVDDPAATAQLATGRLRRKIPELVDALHGHFEAHHALLVSEVLARIDAASATVERLDAEIERELLPFAETLGLLSTIPGVGRRTAEVLIAETDADMDRFPSAADRPESFRVRLEHGRRPPYVATPAFRRG